MNFFIVICFQFLLRAEPWYCFDGIISRVEIMALASNLALRRVNFLESKLKRYYDQKIISFFLPILKAYSLNIQLAKF